MSRGDWQTYNQLGKVLSASLESYRRDSYLEAPDPTIEARDDQVPLCHLLCDS